MMTYEQLKNKVVEIKSKLIYGFFLLVLFAVGWGTGRASTDAQTAETPSDTSNYTTKPAQTAKAQEKIEPKTDLEKEIFTVPEQKVDEKTGTLTATKNKTSEPTTGIIGTDPDPNKPCPVKGNISSTGKVYHVTGGAFYERTTPEQCFNTPDEAETAGFRKSKK